MLRGGEECCFQPAQTWDAEISAHTHTHTHLWLNETKRAHIQYFKGDERRQRWQQSHIHNYWKAYLLTRAHWCARVPTKRVHSCVLRPPLGLGLQRQGKHRSLEQRPVPGADSCHSFLGRFSLRVDADRSESEKYSPVTLPHSL